MLKLRFMVYSPWSDHSGFCAASSAPVSPHCNDFCKFPRLIGATFVLLLRLSSRSSGSAPYPHLHAISGGPSRPRIRGTNGYESTFNGGRGGCRLLVWTR